jgi:mRNA interferase RelE/StbE
MRIRRSGPFKRDFAKLPEGIKRRAEKAFRLLLQDPRHPSLEARIVDEKRRIWKAKVDGGYRFTFQIEGEVIILRRIGPHDLMARPERR